MEGKMQTVLVNPSGKGSTYGDPIAKSTQYMFPYSITFLHNYLLKNNIESKTFDLFEEDLDDFLDYCGSLERPIVGVTSQSYSRYEAIDIIADVKRVSPSSICIVGGKHFGFCAEETLERVQDIDVVVRGEGEITLLELHRCLSQNGDLSKVQGITFRKNGFIVSNNDRPPEKDVEQFSLNFEKLPIENFAKGIYLRNFENEKIRSLPIHLSRGCSRKCVFCSFGLTPYRIRTLDNVITDIITLKERFNYDYFTMCDPSFCERKDFVRAFCQRLIDENANIKWYCEARVDTPLDILELMAKAGCISLDFAIESGSEKVLKAIRKGINIDQALTFAHESSRLGMRTLVFFMISLPDEREEDSYQTLRVAEKMAGITKYIVLNVAQILPGTTLEKTARDRNILPKDFSWFDKSFIHDCGDLAYTNLPIYLEHLTIDFIRKFRGEFQALIDVHFTSPQDLLRMIRKGVMRISHQSPTETLREAKRFANIVVNKLKQ
jgi:anaerobic magnesium-protoporphyrin IX monomethyl ester cyclase